MPLILVFRQYKQESELKDMSWLISADMIIYGKKQYGMSVKSMNSVRSSLVSSKMCQIITVTCTDQSSVKKPD